MKEEYSLWEGNLVEPMKSMCSRKWANPKAVFGSSRDPTPTEIEQADFYKTGSWTNRTLDPLLRVSA